MALRSAPTHHGMCGLQEPGGRPGPTLVPPGAHWCQEHGEPGGLALYIRLRTGSHTIVECKSLSLRHDLQAPGTQPLPLAETGTV